ncbi:MAG: hypothetical protein AB8B80_16325, partial [Marinicellaceae bacterium]
DLHKVSSIVIHEYRAGNLGGICLEVPKEVESEKKQAIEMEAKRAEKKEARKNRRKGRKK